MAPSSQTGYGATRTASAQNPTNNDELRNTTSSPTLVRIETTKEGENSSQLDQRSRRKDSESQKEERGGKERRFGLSRSKPRKRAGDIDPYDSDPGESYRQHCLKLREGGLKSCLGVHKLRQRKNNHRASSRSTANRPEEQTVITSPPSPVVSESGDINSQPPASLPANPALVRYSLRSSITDGSERQPYGPADLELRELRPNSVRINISHWSDFGGRPYMEDRYTIEDMDAVQVEVSPIAEKHESEDVEVAYGPKRTCRVTMPLTFCGVFDGHGGDRASQFCADWMSSYIRNDESYPFDLGYAMKNAFTAADKDFLQAGQPDGTTACAVSIVGGRRVVCANAGDSRAIVVRRDGSVVRLSRDHKPGIPDETRRISELGGRVIYWGRWRVEGLLAVSRSIGDASLKPFVTAEPEICEYDIGKDDWFLIVSSDGVWDVMDNEEAAHVVIASSCGMEDGKLMIDTDRFKLAARNLAEHARSCGSTDNFSVIVVDLKSCGNPAATEGRYEP